MERGEPSTWPECSCPPPCIEYIFDVMWSKTLFKKVRKLKSSFSSSPRRSHLKQEVRIIDTYFVP